MNNFDMLSPNQVIARLDIPSSTLYRWIADGRFPKPIKVGPRKTLFRAADIQKWLDKQAEATEAV